MTEKFLAPPYPEADAHDVRIAELIELERSIARLTPDIDPVTSRADRLAALEVHLDAVDDELERIHGWRPSSLTSRLTAVRDVARGVTVGIDGARPLRRVDATWQSRPASSPLVAPPPGMLVVVHLEQTKRGGLHVPGSATRDPAVERYRVEVVGAPRGDDDVRPCAPGDVVALVTAPRELEVGDYRCAVAPFASVLAVFPQ